MSQDSDLHSGGLVACGGEDGAAVLGALSDGVSQPAEHMGPAIRQRVGLRGDTRLQFTAILLPDEVNVRRTWGHRDHLHPASPVQDPRELPWWG